MAVGLSAIWKYVFRGISLNPRGLVALQDAILKADDELIEARANSLPQA